MYMKQNFYIFIIFSLTYCLLVASGLLIFYFAFGMKITDVSVISNIFVWSATLFAPITAFFIFNGWKSQHNKTVERELADAISLNLNKVKEGLGQIYHLIYLNKVSHPHFYPINNRPLPDNIKTTILGFNKTVIESTTTLNKDLNRLSRNNFQLKDFFDKYNKEFNQLHSHLFYFFDLKIIEEMPKENTESSKKYFIEIYDDYHTFSVACDNLDKKLDEIIFV